MKDPLTDELELDHRTPEELAAQLATLRAELAGRPARAEVARVAAEAAELRASAGDAAALRRELDLLRNRVLPEREREIAELRSEVAELSRHGRAPVMPPEAATPPPGVGALLTLATTAATARDLLAALRCAAPIVADELEWEAVFVWSGTPLRCVAAKVRVGLGAGSFESQSWQTSLRPDGTADHVRASGRAQWISDTAVAADPRMQAAARAGLATAALAPIGGAGVLEAFSSAYRPLDHARLQALSAAGAWLGALGQMHERTERRRFAVA
ncbi:MAG: hypothetical protein ACXVFT_20960 [Solirubrobacteraceae bacterium]